LLSWPDRLLRALPVDTDVARRWAALHVPDSQSERDAQVAATALLHGMTVATRNLDDFVGTGVAVLNPWSPAAADIWIADQGRISFLLLLSFFLRRNDGRVRIVRLSSPQEGKRIQPSAFAALVKGSDATATLFALRRNGIGALPDADTCVKYFIHVDWAIRGVAVMNSTTNPLSASLTAGCLGYFPLGAPPGPVNRVASGVRAHFHWR
jgi:hypothetical protein